MLITIYFDDNLYLNTNKERFHKLIGYELYYFCNLATIDTITLKCYSNFFDDTMDIFYKNHGIIPTNRVFRDYGELDRYFSQHLDTIDSFYPKLFYHLPKDFDKLELLLNKKKELFKFTDFKINSTL